MRVIAVSIDNVATVSEVEVIAGMTTLSGFKPRLNDWKATIRAKREITMKLERLEMRETPNKKLRPFKPEAGFTMKYAMMPKTICISMATISTWNMPFNPA